MASKRKVEDDFIHTISDNDDPIPEEEFAIDQPPKKKSKTSKKDGKRKNADADEKADETGIWGKKDANDGAMDS